MRHVEMQARNDKQDRYETYIKNTRQTLGRHTNTGQTDTTIQTNMTGGYESQQERQSKQIDTINTRQVERRDRH